MVKFCGLRSKLYTYQVQDGPVVKKAKSVAKPAIYIIYVSLLVLRAGFAF